MNSDPMVRPRRETDSRPWGQVPSASGRNQLATVTTRPLQGPPVPELFTSSLDAPLRARAANVERTFFMRTQTGKQERNEQEEAEAAEKTSKCISLLLRVLCCLLFKMFASRFLTTNGRESTRMGMQLKIRVHWRVFVVHYCLALYFTFVYHAHHVKPQARMQNNL
jgi:hypothetical protein